METSNEYLNQVVQEQAQVEGELRARRKARAAARPPASDYDLDEEGGPAGVAPGRGVD